LPVIKTEGRSVGNRTKFKDKDLSHIPTIHPDQKPWMMISEAEGMGRKGYHNGSDIW